MPSKIDDFTVETCHMGNLGDKKINYAPFKFNDEWLYQVKSYTK